MAGNFWKSSHYQEWLLNRQELELGRKEDCEILTNEQLMKLHIFFANFIQSVGEHAQLRQQVIATASVYFKRFYVRNSLSCVEPLLMSLTSIHLAAMVEECDMQNSSKMNQSYSHAVKAKYKEFFNPDCPYGYQMILECEFLLLEMMDCCLIVYHPYRPLMQFVSDLGDESLLPVSWRIVNDTYRCDICLLYPPYLIALACLHMAAVFKKKDIKAWFTELHVELEQIAQITKDILQLYELWRNFKEHKEMKEIFDKCPKPNSNKEGAKSCYNTSGPTSSNS